MLYDHPPEPGELERKPRGAIAPRERLLAAFVVMVAIALVAHFAFDRKERPDTPHAGGASVSEPAEASADGAAPAAAAPAPRAAPARLDGSDPAVRAELEALSVRAEWRGWLAGGDLVRRAVAAVAAVAEGRSPRFALDGLPFPGRFGVVTRGGRSFISPASYARYDGIGGLARELDRERLRSAWRLFHPLAEAAWAEIANDDRDLDETFARAVDHLLATPRPGREIEVVADGALYRYSDRRLEAASAAQKQLLRMGAANAEAVLALLGELRPLFGP